MPNYKKKKTKSKKVNNSSAITLHLHDFNYAKLAGYVKRQSEKKAKQKIASERYTEISEKNKEKTKLQDINAPKSLKEKSSGQFKKIAAYIKGHKKPRDARSVKHINPKHLLIILGFICLALIFLSSISEKVREPFKAIASVVVVPVQNGINSIGLWLSDKIEAQKTLDQLEQENEELKNQIDSLTMELTDYNQQKQELDRLKQLVNLKDKYEEYEMTAAHIVAKDSSKWFSTFTIDKGTNDGIQKDMNVIANGGLVGIVTDCGSNFSTVRSIIDDESAVSAKFEDNSELCIVSGSLTLMEQNLLEFSEVSAEITISNNAAIVTSHVSSKYLPGLLIGYVVDYELDANNLTQSGHLQPVVDFASLEEVLVITTLKETTD